VSNVEDRRGADERLQLRVTVASGPNEVDLVVDGAATDRVGDLARAAAASLGDVALKRLWCERRAQLLDAKTPLPDAGIRWGDRLRLPPHPQKSNRLGRTPLAELLVASGPCAGQRWELGAGSYGLGRDAGSSICLPDPSLSRHHLDVRVVADEISVSDVGSSNGTAIEGQPLIPQTWQTIGNEVDLVLGDSTIRIRSLLASTKSRLSEHGGRLEFNRPPRVTPSVEDFRRVLAAPPGKGRKARLPLAASLVPVGAGLLLFILLKSPIMLAIAGLSPIMAISTYMSDRRSGHKSYARGSADFRTQLAATVAELDLALDAEGRQRRAESPDASSLIDRARVLSPSLWERRPTDPDFLRLRVGLADLPARSVVELADGGEQELRLPAEQELSLRRVVRSVPLTVHLCETSVVGLAGPRTSTSRLARWLILQAALLHSPGDLVIVAALGSDSATEWSWLKWLPHLRSDRVGIQSPPLAVGRARARELLTEVHELASSRREPGRVAGRSADDPPYLLLLADEDADVDRALVSAALSETSHANIAVIWLGRDRRDLPGQAAAIVELQTAPGALTLTNVDSGAVTSNATVEGLPLDIADEAARFLAPLRDVGERARGGDLPRRIGLLELLDLSPPRSEALEERWKRWSGELRSTVGVSARGAFSIDLRSDGPHALIAGTTGSGKSELLRTFVAAAAAAAPPNRVTFLLVDYKGGSAFAPCASLPHVVDVVSDLDEHLAERALVSLEAELKRRERILAQSGAKDLLELQRRDPDACPPLLVIAVDEFAKLRDEVPEFVDGVVDIAQRGRSLGVHMVLAAQTLRNAFTSAIRANTNLRVALRVSEESESEDMIASPAAARIPSGENYRGRAFARTGHGELREFQAAYVSGLTAPSQQRRLEVSVFDVTGAESTGGDPVGSADSDTDSDLTALGTAAREAQAWMGLRMPPPPWLPVLPTLLSLDALDHHDAQPRGVAVGLVDLPHLQRQDPLLIDLPTVGHVAAFGAAGSGKTTMLTTTALALARSATPDELVIYGLDAGSGRLAVLESLPHCAGVVRIDEEERVDRLFRQLLRRIGTRGASARAPHSNETAPHATAVLFLDDLGSFAQQYDRPGFGSPYEALSRVLASGRAAGVHVVLTASRRAALPAALAAHIGLRLVFRMPTEEELLSFGLDTKTVRGARLPVGRGFTPESTEFQTAVPVDGDAIQPFDQAAASLSAERPSNVPRIDVLPTHVPRASLAPGAAADRLPVGLSDEHLGPATLDLLDMHFLVIGSYRSGRSTALATIALSLHTADPAAQLHLLAPRRSPLRDIDIWASAATTTATCTASAVSLLQSLEAGELDGKPVFVFIDDGGELSESTVVSQLEQLVRISRDGSLRVVAATETSAARGIGIGWIRELRKEGHGLLLQPDLAADGDILSARLPRHVTAALTPGRGFVVSRGVAELVQVAS
jgi:S-DNA-T family DNA segregation ATPase FtsK/SpoIIIE